MESVEVILASFGLPHLKGNFPSWQIRGKSVAEIVDLMASHDWSDVNKMIYEEFRRKIDFEKRHYLAKAINRTDATIRMTELSGHDEVDPYIEKDPLGNSLEILLVPTYYSCRMQAVLI